MTQTRGHKRVNLHLDQKVHDRLKQWCIRNGRTLQDGTAIIIDINTRPGQELRLAQPVAAAVRPVLTPAPREAMSQIARSAAVVPAAPAPIFEPSPPFDPEECYAAWLKSADQRRAYAKTKEQCAYYRIEWEPGQKPRPILVDTNMEDDSIDANDGTDDIDADSAQEESEPNPDRTDARPH
jgi:hypothetical protein